MTEDFFADREGAACAVRYGLAWQTVPSGGTIALPVWEIYGRGEIRAAEQTGLHLEAGKYLALFSCDAKGSGAAAMLNGARISHMEAAPMEAERRLFLQGLLSLTASGTLWVANNAPTPGQFSRAVLTVIRL